jgi:co-chaperonin GroES (HSP10)
MAPKDRMNARLERPCRGVIIAVGPKVEYSAVGDIVYFGKYDNDEIEVNKKKLYFMKEEKLAGKVLQS